MATVKIPDPYDRTEFRGRLTDYATAAGIVLVEIELGYRLTVVQAVGGAAASAGTHLGKVGADGKFEGGRAIDLTDWDETRKAKAWRKILGPYWPRAALPGVWGPHGHGLNRFKTLTNRRGLADSAFAQLGKYDRKEDGLAGSNPDRSGLPHPTAVFTMEAYRHVMRNIGLDGGPVPTIVTKARDALVETRHDLGQSIALLSLLDDDDNARQEIDNLTRDRARITATLQRMRKR